MKEIIITNPINLFIHIYIHIYIYTYIPESAGFRIDRIISGIGDDVDLTVLTTDGITAESDSTIGESLSISRPVFVTPPAIIDRVACSTRKVPQFSSSCSAIVNAPAYISEKPSSREMLMTYINGYI